MTAREPGHPLFRTEVLAERRSQWLGTVVVARRRWHGWFALFGAASALAIAALLVFAQYTRTVRVGGWLVPHTGVIKVFAPRPGVVTGLHVAEGAPIRKGEPLLTLSDELQSAALGGTQAEIARRMAERNESLRQEQRKQQQRLAQQQKALAARVAGLRAEETQIGREVELIRGRTDIASRAEALHTQLRARNFISDMRLQQAQSESIEQRARLVTLERNRLTLARERMGAEAELQDLPLKFTAEMATLERALAQLAEEQAAAEAKREFVVPAPQSGTATAIHAVLGGNAGTAAALLSIVPHDARLEAHLYSPSRAVGFLKAGQRVRLRYQPYPYQKFGHYEGTIASVSRSAVSPGDMPAEIAGPAGAAAEPMYRLTVALDRQTVSAYGAEVPLQAGMMLEADVALEKRRLYEWVLDPMYTITGRAAK